MLNSHRTSLSVKTQKARSVQRWALILCISIGFTLVGPSQSFASVTDYIYFDPTDSVLATTQDGYGSTFTDSIEMAWWDRVRTGDAPWQGNLTVVLGAYIDTKPYVIQTELITPKGREIPLTGTVSGNKMTFSLSCYLTISGCTTYFYTYPVSLGSDAETGSYSVKVTANFTDTVCQGTVCQSDVPTSKSVTAINALIVNSHVAPTPTPTPSATPTNSYIPQSEIDFSPITAGSNAGALVCSQNQFTDLAISQYSITGTHWKILDRNGTVVDDYDWPLTLAVTASASAEKIGDGIRSTVFVNGHWVYAYLLIHPQEGMNYSCSVSIVTSSGVGVPIIRFATAPTVTTPTSIVLRNRITTIKCLKGKSAKKVTAVNPVCPKGYRKFK